jgi:hypothetical protein
MKNIITWVLDFVKLFFCNLGRSDFERFARRIPKTKPTVQTSFSGSPAVTNQSEFSQGQTPNG